MDELISEYNNLTKEYLLKLSESYEKNPKVNIPKNSTFKTEDDYIRFRSNSLKEIISVLENVSKQLDKYGKYKTLDPKIIRMTEMNDLANGKFYDYAVGYYNYIDIEPELYELINSHFNAFYELSKKVASAKNKKVSND
jgi:rRNA maturation protein Nop10